MTTASKIIYEIQAAYTGRGAVRQLSDDLKSLKQVESFQAMLDKFKSLNDQFVAAKERMRGLRAEMARPGNEAMAGEYEKSVAAVNKLATAIRSQKNLLDGQRATMRTAGFDLGNLAGEYDRLKQSINGLGKIQTMRNLLGSRSITETREQISSLVKVYRDAAVTGKLSAADQVRALETLRAKTRELHATIANPPKLQNARNLLGISSDAEINAKINRLKQAYMSLAASGRASLGELARAKAALGKQIDELRGKTMSWRDVLAGISSKGVQIGGALAGTAFPVKEAITYETAMAKVGKVVDGTRQQIDGLGDGLEKMTRKIPMTAAELAEIAAAGGSLGLAVGDIQAFVDVAARMATAFDMPAQEAGDAIGKIKNIFNLSIPEVESFGDAINQLGNNTAASEKNIVDVMLRVGGTSQQFGLARENTAALAAAMLSLGKTPETAATGINALLNRMQTATMQAAPFHEALDKIGMSAEGMAEAVARNPQKAITDLLDTLAKLDKRGQSEVLTGLFGAEYQDDIATLVNGMQTYRDALGQVADASSYAGAMNKEFAKQSATTGNQLILLKNAVMEIVRNVGQGLLPAVQKGAEWLTALLTPVGDLTARFPELSGAIVAFVSGAILLNGVKKIFDLLRNAATLFGTESLASFGKAGTGAKTLETAASGSLSKIGTVAGNLGTIIKGLGGLFTAAAIGWEIGTWLNQFGIVQKGMTTLIYWADLLQLSARKMWRALTGGDTAEIDKNIEIAKQAYKERLQEINQEVDDKDKPKDKKPDPTSTDKPKPEPAPLPEPPPEKKPDADQIDGFTQQELEAMDTWDEDKLTEDRKKALEKYRLAKNAGLDPNDPKLKKKRSLSQQKLDALDADQLTEGQLKEREDYYGDTLTTKERQQAEKEEKERKTAEGKAKKEAAAAEKKRLAEEKKGEKKKDTGSEPYAELSRLAKDRLGILDREKADRDKESDAEEQAKEEARSAAEQEKKAKDEERRRQLAEDSSGKKNKGDSEWQKSQENAKKYEESMQQAHEAVAEAGKEAADEWAGAQEQATEKAKSAFEKYADKVKSLQNDIAGREKSLADEIDELDTKTSAESKWRKKAKEAKEYETAAKAAMKAGDLDKALSLSDRSKELYSSLKGGAGSITAEQARRTALRGVMATGEMGIDLAGIQKREAAKQALFAVPPGVTELFGDLTSGIRGKMAGIAGWPSDTGQDGAQPAKIHELKFKGGSLRGEEADVEALLNLLTQAGMNTA